MNLCILIVQIVSTPQQYVIQQDISVTEMQVLLFKSNQKKGFDKFKTVFWGDLGKKVTEHFRVGDYIIIEGILKFESSNSQNFFQKELKFTVFNICPFLLVNID
jgi:single-stranded DNA-binding protein